MVRYVVSDSEVLAESTKAKSRRKKWITGLAIVLGIGGGAGVLEACVPGTMAYLLSMAAALLIAIWGMICDVADACGDFIQYVRRLRS